jgi:hypothetical protein
VLNEKKLLRKWKYGEHFFPHDVKQKEWLSDKSRIETLSGLGIEPSICPDHRVMDGVNAVRRVLDRTFFDPDYCARGLEALRNYIRDWSDELRDWQASPRHDWASHGADALRIFAMGHVERSFKPSPLRRDYGPPVSSGTHWSA